MKCIMNNFSKNITRVSDDIAKQKVDSGDFKYVSKSLWKEKTRDASVTKT